MHRCDGQEPTGSTHIDCRIGIGPIVVLRRELRQQQAPHVVCEMCIVSVQPCRANGNHLNGVLYGALCTYM